MRKALATAVVSAALSAILAVSTPTIAQEQPAQQQPAPAAQPQAEVPVKIVTLFSSGVGYFEHFGSIAGNASTELRFKTAQINDILKSLVLQDLDGGRVTTITYPSQDPIAKILRSFQVDITSNPSLAELLNQLRGAKVKVAVTTQELAGTILGVEKKPKAVGEVIVEVPALNLLTGASIRSVELADIRDLQLEDAALQEELSKALTALAAARDQDKKPVLINFLGEGERRVRIGYVVETPIWKTSYRLILDDPAPKPVEGQPAPQPGPGGKLQGWAIVENQTENDWNNVQLSLVSGRPISFIQDLYQPLYIPRPVVQPQLFASLRPQMYEGGMAPDAANMAEPQASAPPMAPGRANENRARKALGAAGGVMADRAASEVLAAPMDPSASIASVASAGQVGELFQYTVGNVSLPRQKSAMIPIVTDPVKVERVSIFNLDVMPRHPLNGALVTNTTEKHLLQGPITVFDGGSYAGDARIDNLPPGQQRLLSYGIDLQVVVDAANNEQTNTITAGKLVRGVLQVQRKLVNQRTYVFENKSPRDKSIVVEHPRFGGEWKLIDTAKPFETTDNVYRFRTEAPAGKKSEFKVTQEVVQYESIAILPADLGQLQFYARNGAIPQNVRDALAEAIRRKTALVETQRQIAEMDRQTNAITQEQNRIRENLRAVNDRNDQYYARLLKKLNEQETQLEQLQGKRAELQQQLQKQQADLENYLQNLNVG